MRYILRRASPSASFKKEPYNKKDTGTRIRWKPDIKVFTDIDIPLEYYQETILRQSVVNAGIKISFFAIKPAKKSFDKYEYCYENGIVDYIKEFVGDDAFLPCSFWQGERKGRDRADLPEYKVKLNVAL